MAEILSLEAAKDEGGVIAMFEDFLAMAKRGEITEAVVSGKCEYGGTKIACSSTVGAQAMAGYLLDQAIFRLGYKTR